MTPVKTMLRVAGFRTLRIEVLEIHAVGDDLDARVRNQARAVLALCFGPHDDYRSTLRKPPFVREEPPLFGRVHRGVRPAAAGSVELPLPRI